jgi:hypothetical protein
MAGTQPLARKRISAMRRPLQLQRKFQNVSARGIFQARYSIGNRNLTRVSWVLKMI